MTKQIECVYDNTQNKILKEIFSQHKMTEEKEGYGFWHILCDGIRVGFVQDEANIAKRFVFFPDALREVGITTITNDKTLYFRMANLYLLRLL